MYIESVKLKFFENIPQSKQMGFLSEMSNALESVHIKNIESSGFTISITSSRKVKLDIWHPSKRDVFWSYIMTGYSENLFEVISPKEFYEWYKEENP